jgi:hypothetical protein
MKKFFSLLIMFGVVFSANAFDLSLNGSWGLVIDGEELEYIRFNNNEIIVMDRLFRSSDYEEADDTIFIDDFDGDSVLIQYYQLSSTKLLFFMTIGDLAQSINLILSKL